jgi:hypothetical protein
MSHGTCGVCGSGITVEDGLVVGRDDAALLAALETLLDNGDDPHPLSGRDPTVRREDVGPARAAIAKAKGREA